jgi:hypothetical protein
MSKILKAGPAKVLIAAGLGLFTLPLWAANPAGPGAVNYVEGQVDVDGQPLTSQSVGHTAVQTGQVLETNQGKTEMLLSPGVFLRLGNDSAVRLDTGGLTNTRVTLLRGQAMVEADEILPGSSVQINDGTASANVVKRGLFEFTAAPQSRVAVYEGELRLQEGDRQVTLKKGHELALMEPNLKTASFDRKAHDDLYNWSSVRSAYLAQAANESARTFVVDYAGWYGPGWYWNPWWDFYSFIPGAGILYSPFGWGFYSPALAYYAPVYVGRFGGYPAIARGGVHGFRGTGTVGAVRGFNGGGFHGFAGGGFRGGFGGGFHGGGFGGGRR